VGLYEKKPMNESFWQAVRDIQVVVYHLDELQPPPSCVKPHEKFDYIPLPG
jgi:hypothetical protein